ncbi:MAG: hypothetical protein AB7T31_13665 [Gemmatimonadales bacterium]
MTERPSEGRATDKDQIRPFHAKEEVSSGQETADVVAAVLKHAAARDEAAKKRSAPRPQPIWMLPMGLTLAVLATFLLVAPPPWVVINPIAAQAPEEALADTRRAVYVYASRIEGYRAMNGRLPQTLAEAGVTVEDVGYSLLGAGYVLTVPVGEDNVVYNSSESLTDWAARVGVNFEMGG